MIRHANCRARGTSLAFLLLVVVSLAGCSNGGVGERGAAEEILQQGLQAHARGDLEAAERAYLQVIELDPQNKFAYYNLGVISQDRGETEQAVERYRTALRIDPDFVPALFNLAIVRTQSGDDAGAVELYEHIVEVDPSNAAAHLNLGFLLIDQGKEARGRLELDEAVRLDPSLEGRIDPETSGESPVAASPSS